MNRQWMWVAVGAATIATGLMAQEPAPAPKPRRAPSPEARAYSFVSDNRGRIGVIVNTAANSETDKVGARIDGITPGGPAEKAGLKVGDIITKFNGTALAGVAAEDEDQSGPGMKLIDLAHQLDPGDTTRVEYRRGTETKTATLVAEAMKDMTLGPIGRDRVFVGPELPRMPMPPMNFGGRGFFLYGDSWGDLDLVKLNPDLGDYFGTKEGILVVKAPADSSVPLKSGDVILAIGGRKPSSPAHAMRILRSYEPGETLTIDVLRKQKRLSLTYKVPEERYKPDGRHSWWGGESGSDNEPGDQSLWRGLEEAQQALRAASQDMSQQLRRSIGQSIDGDVERQLNRALRAARVRQSVSL